jgi:hypothetical protein
VGFAKERIARELEMSREFGLAQLNEKSIHRDLKHKTAHHGALKNRSSPQSKNHERA